MSVGNEVSSKNVVYKESVARTNAHTVGSISMETFHEKSHFWGRFTLWAMIILTWTLPIYLSFVLGFHPG